MRNIRPFTFGLAIIIAPIISCNRDKTDVVISSKNALTCDSAIILADSLVYGISTHASENADISENEAFKSFLQKNLINFIFEQLYLKKLKAYDFFTGKELSLDEIRLIEKREGYSRSKVGKVQFNELWYFDKNGILNKQVNSMTFGVESYSNQGNFIGYNALFKIKSNPTSR